MNERFAGVYCVRHIPSGTRYVGSSTHVLARWLNHCGVLNRRKHINSRLQADWIADGPAAFTFEMLETVAAHDVLLAKAENKWLDQFRAETPDLIYNQPGRAWRHGGEPPAMLFVPLGLRDLFRRCAAAYDWSPEEVLEQALGEMGARLGVWAEPDGVMLDRAIVGVIPRDAP